MDSLFGVSMTLIMYVLLGALAVSLSVVLYVVVRNRVMFLLGVRNMPRRVARTVLIVVGLMLSTLIISAAFTTGDTVDRSLTNTVFTLLGHVDEVIQRQGEGDNPPNEINSTIPQDINDRLRSAVEAAADPNIDGYLPMLFEQVPIINPESRLSEPSATFVGLDADSMDGFPDVISATTGEALDIGSLAADEVFLNESAADALAAEPGDRVQVFVQLQPHEFTIVDIVEDRFTTGVGNFDVPEGLVTRLDTLQQIFERPGEVSIIAISNRGGVRDGVDLTDEVVGSLTSIIAAEGLTREDGGIGLAVDDIKRELVETAELAGNVMATFFLVFGLFSIAAGVLLIIMIFSMLAAERKSELGMARAIGTKRGHLVQMFLSEGMAYNVLAAMVGAGLGILVSFGMMLIMARIFSEFGLNIQPHVTLRSMVVSYSLGVVLTFVTVTFASWRVSNLNIVAAIRDLPETIRPNPEEGTLRGYLRGVLNAAVAVATAPIAAWLYFLRGHPFSWPANQRPAGERMPVGWLLLIGVLTLLAFLLALAYLVDVLLLPVVVLTLLVFSLTLSYLVAVLLVRLTRDRKPRDLPNWLLLTGIAIPPVGLVAVALQDRDRPIAWSVGFATLALALGGLLVYTGLNGDTAFLFALGSSLMFVGTAIVLRFAGVPERPLFSTLSVGLLTLWGFLAGNRLEFLFGELEGDVEMFFLSGVVMIAASTFVLVYNMDIVLPVISRFGGLFSGILPAVRTAVAYPMANRFRTGMTLAMISLVIFALTMMSTMNLNFNRLFLTDAARGGWDVIAVENLNNPIVDLAAELEESGSSAPDSFRAVGRVSLGARSSVRQVQDDQTEFDSYPVFGVDAGFVDGGLVPLSTRARGFDSDEAVWQAMKTRDDVAVVDHFSTESGGFFGDESFHISGIDSEAEAFDPVMLEIVEPLSGATRRVEVIGVIELGASAAFFGIYVPQETFDLVYDEPLFTRHLVSLQDPDESKAVAREIESSLFTFGVQSESLKQLVEDEQQLFRNFFLLMQGFMGLGLFVGIAAVGVIAFRTVVERRQQIGMLRAIGYKRSTVALSFMLESSFVTLLAIGSGVGLAIWLSY
ncbi:MAG: FtsX-like permease family protein, partial [Chloroflexi bacterium]|nr:FtsX-like permease family protein [Chloroflexota bacterium]